MIHKKWLSLILTATMVMSLIPATVLADGPKVASGEGVSVVENSLDVLDVKIPFAKRVAAAFPFAFPKDEKSGEEDVMMFTDPDVAGEYIGQLMLDRVEEFQFDFKVPYKTYSQDFNRLKSSYANILTHNPDNPKEGDYLRWHLKNGCGFKYATDSGYEILYDQNWDPEYVIFHFIFYSEYQSTKAEEDALDVKLAEVLASLNLEGKSDYEKFMRIYNYITDHVTYDYTYTKRSAYNALVEGTAVCQGYASLLYRMLLEAGVENRIISGTATNSAGKEEPHGWNIVKFAGDDVYYYADATWDALGVAPYGLALSKAPMYYRLKSAAVFEDHDPDASEGTIFTQEFWAEHPISTTDYVAPAFNGYALRLFKMIGVQFLVYIPDDIDTSSVYVEFTLSDGRKSTVAFDEALASSYEDAYWFTCDINALELADTITATLHFNENQSLTNQVTAIRYCDYLVANSNVYGEAAARLAQSIHDYGYYLQKSGWNDGARHVEIKAPMGELGDSNIQAVREELANNSVAAFKNLDTSVVENAKFALVLNADTKMAVYFKPADGASFPTDGMQAVQFGEDTWYSVSTPSIIVTSLGKMNTFYVTTQNGRDVAEVQASALSYIYAVLGSSSFGSEKKLAMVSYYLYYKASQAYVNYLTGG